MGLNDLTNSTKTVYHVYHGQKDIDRRRCAKFTDWKSTEKFARELEGKVHIDIFKETVSRKVERL
jgi:hypothetical protein